eukprot:Partr_v1_DN28133_c0_g1_i7_m55263 putative Adaptor-related protein complex
MRITLFPISRCLIASLISWMMVRLVLDGSFFVACLLIAVESIQGCDLSPLYADVAMLISTPISPSADLAEYLAIKRVIYRFLCTYSRSSPSLVLLCLNGVEKDLKSAEPVVRCLALSCYPRFEHDEALRRACGACFNALSDRNVEVRVTALQSIALLFRSSPAFRGLIFGSLHLIYALLASKQCSPVVVGAIAVLSEVENSRVDDEVSLGRSEVLAIVSHLDALTALSSCSALVAALHLLSRYRPSSEVEMGDDEVLALMNILDPHFESDELSVFLATTRCFLQLLSSQRAGLYSSVYDMLVVKAKDRLLHFVNSGRASDIDLIVYHLLMLYRNSPHIFTDADMSKLLIVKIDSSFTLELLFEYSSYSDTTGLLEYLNRVLHQHPVWATRLRPHIVEFYKRHPGEQLEIAGILMDVFEKLSFEMQSQYMELLSALFSVNKKVMQSHIYTVSYKHLQNLVIEQRKGSDICMQATLLFLAYFSEYLPVSVIVVEYLVKNRVITADEDLYICVCCVFSMLKHYGNILQESITLLSSRLSARPESVSWMHFLRSKALAGEKKYWREEPRDASVVKDITEWFGRDRPEAEFRQ